MRFTLLLAILVLAIPVHSRGLDDGDIIDSVFVHAQTGKPALLLSVDKPVISESEEKQLGYKLGTYIGFVRSGDLYSRYPKANRSERPLIIFVFEFQPPPKVKEMSFRARDKLATMGFDIELKVYDEGAKRNVDLAP